MIDIDQDNSWKIYIKISDSIWNSRTTLTYSQCLDLELFGEWSDFDIEKAKVFYNIEK